MMTDRFPRVPDAAIGLWRRVSIAVGNGPEDRTTSAFWGQTASLYIDVRVPAGRPTCRKTDLIGTSDEELQALGRQQGFAGRLVCDGDRFLWHRDIDLQPNTGRPDTGRVRIDSDTLHETGVSGIPGVSYAEVFERVASGSRRRVALRTTQGDTLIDGATLPSLYLVIIDDDFLLARARPEGLPDAPALGPLLVEAQRNNADRIPVLLDCEISKGRLGTGDGRWIVDLSTHPWREQKTAFEVGPTELDGDILTCHTPSGTMRWTVEDSNLAAKDLVQLFSPDSAARAVVSP